MTEARTSWHNVVQRVPDAAAAATPAAAGASAARALALPRSASPAQYLAALRASASVGESTQRKILNILSDDAHRRAKIARDDANTVQKVVIVSAIILLTVTVAVLMYPASLNDLDDYFLDAGVPTLVCGILALVSLMASAVMERRSTPRSLPYAKSLLIVYAILFALGAVMLSLHLTSESRWSIPGATLSVVFAAVAAIGYVVLYFSVRTKQTLFMALHGDGPQSREFDEALDRHIRKIVRGHQHVDLDALRAHTVAGVRRLYEDDRIGDDAAVAMLQSAAAAQTSAHGDV